MMARLAGDGRVRRETSAIVQRRPLVIEIRAHTVYLRLKGVRWGYELDYESIWMLGAKKAAAQARLERQNGGKERKPR